MEPPACRAAAGDLGGPGDHLFHKHSSRINAHEHDSEHLHLKPSGAHDIGRPDALAIVREPVQVSGNLDAWSFGEPEARAATLQAVGSTTYSDEGKHSIHENKAVVDPT